VWEEVESDKDDATKERLKKKKTSEERRQAMNETNERKKIDIWA
jgi:hypothetical protein